MSFIKNFIKSERPFLWMTPALAWQLCFFALPLLFVIQLGFCKGILQNFTSEYFQQVLHVSHFFVIFRSLTIATVTAFGCLLVGYPVAYFLALYLSPRYKSLFLFLIALPFLTNLLVQMYAWFFILEKNGVLNKLLSFLHINVGNLLNTSFSMYLVMFHVYLPFMIMPLYSIMEKINIRLLESSSDLGASYRQTLCRIILPLSLPGIQTGFFLVYVTSFGEYAIPSLLGGQKNFYVGTLISEYFFIGKNWHVGAAFTILSSILFIISVYIYTKMLRFFIKFLQKVS